jgi:hypothetical protein
VRTEPADLSALVEQMAEASARLRGVLLLVLDHVDYTAGACRLNSPIGGILPEEILKRAHEVLALP